MRILIVTPWWPRPGAPGGSFVEDQARAIAARHEVAVLHLPDVGAAARLDERRGDLRVIVAGTRIAVPPAARPVAAAARALAPVRRLVRSGFRPQLIHAHVFTGALAALPAARALGVPLVVSEHFSGLARARLTGRARLAARTTFRAADVVCPVSESLAAAVRSLAPGARVRVVPNAVDTDLFHPPDGARRDGLRRLLAVGSLMPAKGMRHLVAALRPLAERRDDWRLELVGEGPERAALAARVRELDLASRVALPGRLDRAVLAARMRAADLLVVPSEWETFSVAAAEALCAGVPVVASDVGGLPEVVRPDDGRLVRPGQPAELAAAIDDALDRFGPGDRARIARRAAGRFGFAAVAEAWDGVYGAALEARSG